MTDLSHWDFAIEFLARDAAALMGGIDPSDAEDNWQLLRPIFERLEQSYDMALRYYRLMDIPYLDEQPKFNPEQLASSKMIAYRESQNESVFSDWLVHEKKPRFENQTFARNEIGRWLAAIGQQSDYAFDREMTSALNATRNADSDDDPTNLPGELDAANLAFRAVTNGYGNQSATFKNRLRAYLAETFPDFKNEVIERISTVANPDKSTGRKKQHKE